jgi:hypothetical protein
VATRTYIPTNGIWGLLFSAFSPAFVGWLFFMISILTGVRWNHSVIVICISFMAKNVEHCRVHSFAIFISFKNWLFNQFVHFLVGSFVLLVFNFWALHILWILILHVMTRIQRFLSHFVSSLLFLVFPIMCRTFLIWCIPIGQFLFLHPAQLESNWENHYLFLYIQVFSLYFPPVVTKFMVLY